jgi:hypothetical protein
MNLFIWIEFTFYWLHIVECEEIIMRTKKEKINKKPATNPEGKSLNAQIQDLKMLCSILLEEQERLHFELARINKENDQLKKSLGSLLREEIAIDKEALLAQFGKEPPLSQLIAELEESQV